MFAYKKVEVLGKIIILLAEIFKKIPDWDK